jgi:lipopolysaccharide transport system permease protein
LEKFDLVIEAGRPERHYWADLWRFRGLLGFLAWRDLLVRYKQTLLGVVWSVLRPLLTMVVFVVLFGQLAHFPSHGAPYPILVFAALLPWQFFATALAESSGSLVASQNMISKVFFPRMIIPASTIIAGLVDFLISLALLVVLMAWYRYAPTWRVVALPAFLLMVLAAVLGAGLWFSALSVKYRDFRYVVPFVVQFGLYASPVGFSSDIVPREWRLLYSVNPMAGAIDGFRWAILRQSPIHWPGMAVSAATALLLLATGILFFRRTERTFADVI